MSTRWRGLVRIVRDAVEHGSRAVERVHLATAARPFAVAEAIPAVSPAATIVHAIHDTAVSATYSAVRLANAAAVTSVDTVLEVLEERAASET